MCDERCRCIRGCRKDAEASAALAALRQENQRVQADLAAVQQQLTQASDDTQWYAAQLAEARAAEFAAQRQLAESAGSLAAEHAAAERAAAELRAELSARCAAGRPPAGARPTSSLPACPSITTSFSTAQSKVYDDISRLNAFQCVAYRGRFAAGMSSWSGGTRKWRRPKLKPNG